MRDPKRIDTFCKRLADAWKRIPDMRFFQLMENVTMCNNMPFFIEDNEAIKMIEQFVDKYAPAQTDIEESESEDYMGGF